MEISGLCNLKEYCNTFEYLGFDPKTNSSQGREVLFNHISLLPLSNSIIHLNTIFEQLPI